ncbi:MAG: hypothetical protein IKD10_00670 [Lentisphaeria bacterium]|nr:hypothetical protein [Lentisphaeria bacterium]
MKKLFYSTILAFSAGITAVSGASFEENFNGDKLASEWQIFWQEKCDTIESIVKNNTLTIKGLKNAKLGANASYDRFIGEIGGDFDLRCEVAWQAAKPEIAGSYGMSVSNANGEIFFRVSFTGSADGKKFTISGRPGHQSQLIKSTPLTVKAPAQGVLTVTRRKSIYVICWNKTEVARVNSDCADASLYRITVNGVNPGSLSLRKMLLKSVE